MKELIGVLLVLFVVTSDAMMRICRCDNKYLDDSPFCPCAARRKRSIDLLSVIAPQQFLNNNSGESQDQRSSPASSDLINEQLKSSEVNPAQSYLDVGFPYLLEQRSSDSGKYEMLNKLKDTELHLLDCMKLYVELSNKVAKEPNETFSTENNEELEAKIKHSCKDTIKMLKDTQDDILQSYPSRKDSEPIKTSSNQGQNFNLTPETNANNFEDVNESTIASATEDSATIEIATRETPILKELNQHHQNRKSFQPLDDSKNYPSPVNQRQEQTTSLGDAMRSLMQTKEDNGEANANEGTMSNVISTKVLPLLEIGKEKGRIKEENMKIPQIITTEKPNGITRSIIAGIENLFNEDFEKTDRDFKRAEENLSVVQTTIQTETQTGDHNLRQMSDLDKSQLLDQSTTFIETNTDSLKVSNDKPTEKDFSISITDVRESLEKNHSTTTEFPSENTATSKDQKQNEIITNSTSTNSFQNASLLAISDVERDEESYNITDPTITQNTPDHFGNSLATFSRSEDEPFTPLLKGKIFFKNGANYIPMLFKQLSSGNLQLGLDSTDVCNKLQTDVSKSKILELLCAYSKAESGKLIEFDD